VNQPADAFQAWLHAMLRLRVITINDLRAILHDRENLGLCATCTSHADGAHTCLGAAHPNCRINARVAANDFVVDVSIEVQRTGSTER